MSGGKNSLDPPKPLESSTPTRGYDVGTTFALKAGWPCMDTEEGLTEVLKWLARSDRQEAALQMLRHGGEIVGGGWQVKLLDRGFLKVKVRVAASGRECWMPAEAAEK